MQGTIAYQKNPALLYNMALSLIEGLINCVSASASKAVLRRTEPLPSYRAADCASSAKEKYALKLSLNETFLAKPMHKLPFFRG